VDQALWVSGFGVWQLQMSNTNTQQLLNREKCKWNVGPALRGFGVWDFGVYEHPMHKQNEIRNAKLRNVIRVWAQQFRVSVFGKAKELCAYVTSKSRMHINFVFNRKPPNKE
jgi:hypothetical protein